MDALLMAYRLGRQSIGRRIISEMNAIDPALYPRFLQQVAASQETGGRRRKQHNKRRGTRERDREANNEAVQ